MSIGDKKSRPSQIFPSDQKWLTTTNSDHSALKAKRRSAKKQLMPESKQAKLMINYIPWLYV